MITEDDYINQHLAGHEREMTDEIRDNAKVLCGRVKYLLGLFGDEDRGLRSGWRPAEVNRRVGGAPNSKHMTGQAMDIEDSNGKLDLWMRGNIAALEQLGLWVEMYTPTWAHVQTVAPASGHRFFSP